MEDTTVAILGVGGVGSFAAEACARSGIGRIILVDKDDIDITNINRQLVAYLSTIGRSKTEIMQERIADINKECEVISLHMFYTEETAESFLVTSRTMLLMRLIQSAIKSTLSRNVSHAV